jgi:hypothetical protein
LSIFFQRSPGASFNKPEQLARTPASSCDCPHEALCAGKSISGTYSKKYEVYNEKQQGVPLELTGSMHGILFAPHLHTRQGKTINSMRRRHTLSSTQNKKQMDLLQPSREYFAQSAKEAASVNSGWLFSCQPKE